MEERYFLSDHGIHEYKTNTFQAKAGGQMVFPGFLGHVAMSGTSVITHKLESIFFLYF